MNTDDARLTPADVPCRHRQKARCDNPNLFCCDVHGVCSIERLHPRVRACVACSDRTDCPSQPSDSPGPLLLGNLIESSLSAVGITKERVSDWIGAPCNCEATRDKLNQLHLWALRFTSGKVEQAKQTIESLLGGDARRS